MKSRPEREKAARCGCGLLENVADLVVQRCRRTRRDPSSSNERRRKVARGWVRLNVMTPPYIRKASDVKSGWSEVVSTSRPGKRAKQAQAGIHNRRRSWGEERYSAPLLPTATPGIMGPGVRRDDSRRGPVEQSTPRDAAVQVVFVGSFDLRGDDLADPQRTPA